MTAEKFPMPNMETEEAKAPSFERPLEKNKTLWEKDRFKMKTMGLDGILLQKETIDLRFVEQLVDTEQLNALGYLLRYAQTHIVDGRKTLKEVIEKLYALVEENGISAVCEGNYLPVNMAIPRKQEMFACFNRYRGL